MQFKSLDALVGLVTSLAILLALLPVEWQYPLVYQRDNFHWYQLFTTNLIHENTRHLLLNLVGLIFHWISGPTVYVGSSVRSDSSFRALRSRAC